MKQKPGLLKVAIQGGIASFHDIAAREYFQAQPMEAIPCRTFQQVCHKVTHREVDCGILAIENSLAGSILPNYGLLLQYQLSVTGEYYLHIHHHLLALPGEHLQDIHTVRSHPMALAQCSEFLETLPRVAQIETEDTAESAREIATKKEKGVAAIASLQAASLYGLGLVRRNIENLQQNYTRFFILSRESRALSAAADKASLNLRIGHHVGSLAGILEIFKRHHINLTLIQSIPIPGEPDQYRFQVDIEWETVEQFEAVREELIKNTQEFHVLGVYTKGARPW